MLRDGVLNEEQGTSDPGGLGVLDFWHQITLETVRGDAPDLTARQMAVLLTVYLGQPPHTVKGMAESLKASKPAITRALDTLSQMGFIRRQRDARDKRIVLVQKTHEGAIYLNDLANIVRAVQLRVRAGERDAPSIGTGQ